MKRPGCSSRWIIAGIALVLGYLCLNGDVERPLLAANIAQAQSDPRWNHFTQDKGGLLSNNVWTINGSERELWFGTDIGVARYNGAWSEYIALAGAIVNDDLGHRVPSGVVHALEIGADGQTLWAATDTGCVAIWRDGSWKSIAQFNSPIYDLLHVGDTLWIGTADGIYLLRSEQPEMLDAVGRQPIFAFEKQGATIWVGAANGLWRHTEGIWSRISADNDFFASGVYALEVSDDGVLLAGTPYGLAWREQGSSEWQYREVLDELGHPALVQALAVDNDGFIWAGTDGAGALELRDNGRVTVRHGYTGDPNLETRFVRDVAIDVDGAVWMATPAGVFQYQKQMWYGEIQGDGVEDPLNYVNDLLLDSKGYLWIATGGGGVRRKHGKLGPDEFYTEEDGVPNTVLALAEDSEGGIWAGSFWGVVRYVDGHWNPVADTADLPDQVVTSLLHFHNRMWIGTEGGVAVYDPKTGQIQHESMFDGISIEALAEDSIGRLWVGTTSAGIWYRQSDGRWQQFRHNPLDETSLPGDEVVGSGLVRDAAVDGGMWAILSQKGLAHWDGRQWEMVGEDGVLPSNLLWTLHVEPETGMLWIGSEAGFSRYDGLTWETIDSEDGLQSSVVYAIAGNPDVGYWVGGRTGLSHYQPDRTPPWIRIESVAGKHEQTQDGRLQVTTSDEVLLNLAAGDLQTNQDRLRVFYRKRTLDEISAWSELTQRSLTISFAEAGMHAVEFIARDLSFNYSSAYLQEFVVVEPPPTVAVPLLGVVERDVFHTLLFLGTVAILGASYVTLEIVQERRRSNEAVRRGYNPYISGEPVRSNDMFYGRHELLQRIVDTLHNNSIMIHGERRIGKTTLLYQLATVLRDVDDVEYWFVPIYIDLEGTPQEAFFHYLIEEIVEGVASLDFAAEEIMPILAQLDYREKVADGYSDRDFNRDLRTVIDALVAYGSEFEPGKHVRLILLLDEMDVLSQYDRLVQQQLRRTFMRDFATTLGAVVAGIQISKDWDRVESPWYNLFNEIALEPFTREQGITLLIEPVRGIYAYDPAAIEFILEQSDGRPYKIQQYGLEAVNHMLTARRRRITIEDAIAAHERIVNGLNGFDPTNIGLDKEPVDKGLDGWRIFGIWRDKVR